MGHSVDWGCLSYASSVNYSLPISTGQMNWARVLFSLSKREKLDCREGCNSIKNNNLIIKYSLNCKWSPLEIKIFVEAHIYVHL